MQLDGSLIDVNGDAHFVGAWDFGMRKNLIGKRILKQDGHVLIFTEDYLFNNCLCF